MLKRELIEVERVIREKSGREQDVIVGNIKVTHRKDKAEYYIKKEGAWKYLKKQEHKLAYAIAQRDYDREVLQRACERKTPPTKAGGTQLECTYRQSPCGAGCLPEAGGTLRSV